MQYQQFRTDAEIEQIRNEWYGGAMNDVPEHSWLVDGVVASGSITWMYGRPGSYKSFIALDLALRVATGGSWCGREVQQGAVAYWAAEDARGAVNRRRAWDATNGGSGPLLVWGSTACASDISDESGKPLALLNVDAINRRLEAAQIDMPLRLLVIDTYAKTSRGDTREDVYAYVRALRKTMRQYPQLSVVVIDHTNKSGDSYIGSQSKLGDCDAMLYVARRGSTALVTTRGDAGKIRNADGFEHGFELVPSAEYNTLVARATDSTAVVEAAVRALTAAEVLAEVIESAQDELPEDELRRRFFEHSAHEGMRPGTIRVRWSRVRDGN